MPIKVSCKCGASFTAKDELAGQALLCPKCHQPLTIGAPEPQPEHHHGGGIADLFEEVGLKEVRGPRCPKCGTPLQPNSVLCVECGLHLQTGEKIAGAKVRSKGAGGHGAVAETLLARAADKIREDSSEEKKTRAQGAPALVYFIAFVGVIAFAACMFTLPRDTAFFVNGIWIMVFGGLMINYYGIRMIIAAFYESTTCGLLMFVPFYSLYYLITRWKSVGGYFIMQMAGSAVVGLGFGMVAISPMMAMSKEDVRLLPPARPPVKVAAALSDTMPAQLPASRTRPGDHS